MVDYACNCVSCLSRTQMEAASGCCFVWSRHPLPAARRVRVCAWLGLASWLPPAIPARGRACSALRCDCFVCRPSVRS